MGRPRLNAALAPACAVALLAAACSEPHPSPAMVHLDAAQQRWQTTLHADYDLIVQRSCFCALAVVRPVRVSVRGGTPTALVYADSNTAADTALFTDYRSVDRMFAFLRTVLAAKPDSFSATYDPVWGYPTQVAVDPNFGTVDEEYAFQVTGFTAAPVVQTVSKLHATVARQPNQRLQRRAVRRE
jgi:hypothetical protein